MKFKPQFINRRVMNKDATFVGNLHFDNGIISNFSTASYMNIGVFDPGTKPWEMYFKVNSGNTTRNNPIITPTYDLKNVLLTFDSELIFYFSTDGTTYQSITNSTRLESNTDYWMKCGYDGSSYYCAVSIDDGESWMTNSMRVTGTVLASPMTIGCNYARWGMTGSFDSLNSWIKIDGEYWWKFYDDKYYRLVVNDETTNSDTICFLSH